MTGTVPSPLPTPGRPDGAAELALTPVGEPPSLRADAARNRTRLLEAASQLMARCGAAQLTMDAVATAAGVGKGTVFRRFGDRTGLLVALLDHREQQLQAAFLSGPAPLGPDAPPLERLHAFGPALVRHQRDHHELILSSRTDPLRTYRVPANRLRLTHVTMLLRQAGVAGDAELLAHTLLGSVDAVLVQHLTVELGMPLDRVDAAWHDLVTRLVPQPPPKAPTSAA